MRRTLIVIAGLAAGLSAAAWGAGDAPAAGGLRLFTVPRDKAAQPLAPGGTVPNAVGTCYGWLLRIAPARAERRFEERLILPEASSHWGGDGSKVADDRRSATSAIVAKGGASAVDNAWCVAEGDPDGEYAFVVSEGGKVVGRGAFFLKHAG